MYHERYDPLLHPEDVEHGSTISRAILVSAVVSGSLLLYAAIAILT